MLQFQSLPNFEFLCASIVPESLDALSFGLDIAHEVRILFFQLAEFAPFLGQCAKPLRTSQHDCGVRGQANQRGQSG